MYLLLIAAATFLFCGATPAVNIEKDSDGILVLNEGNFQYAINKNPLIAVIFYKLTAQGVDSMEPVYKDVAGKLKAARPGIKLAKVNPTKERTLTYSYTMDILPTLVFFKKGKRFCYTNVEQWTADDIVATIQTAASRTVKKCKWGVCFRPNPF